MFSRMVGLAILLVTSIAYVQAYPKDYDQTKWRIHSVHTYGKFGVTKEDAEAECERFKRDRLERMPQTPFVCEPFGGHYIQLMYSLFSCPIDFTWNQELLRCDKKEGTYCRSPYTLSEDRSVCEARCFIGETWDGSRCISNDFVRNSCTTSNHPIDFHNGEKLLSETLLTSSGLYPIEVVYSYSSQVGKLKKAGHTFAGKRVLRDIWVADTEPPRTKSSYGLEFPNRVDRAPLPNIDEYWRHNYQEYIIPTGNQYTLSLSDGTKVVFGSGGKSVHNPTLRLTTGLLSQQSSFAFEISKVNSSVKKYFDELGRLSRIQYTPGVFHDVEYIGNAIYRISHSNGDVVNFDYEVIEYDWSAYTTNQSPNFFPSKVYLNGNLRAEVEWEHGFSHEVGTSFLLTSIARVRNNEITYQKLFEYDHAFPASVTNVKIRYSLDEAYKDYAHFRYDDHGRAYYSALHPELEKIKINYVDDNTRVITDAAYYQKTFTFQNKNGRRYLMSVKGRGDSNCPATNLEYEYDPVGNVSLKTENGISTQYIYNSEGLEVSRTEAYGTPEAITVTTTWNGIWNKPSSITYPDRKETFTYSDLGLLIKKDQLPVNP